MSEYINGFAVLRWIAPRVSCYQTDMVTAPQNNRIRAALALRRLSARRAARLIGLSPLSLYRRLTGKLPWRPCELLALSVLLEVPLVDLGPDALGELDAAGLPACLRHAPAPDRPADGRCSTCGRAPCAHAPDADPDSDGAQ